VKAYDDALAGQPRKDSYELRGAIRNSLISQLTRVRATGGCRDGAGAAAPSSYRADRGRHLASSTFGTASVNLSRCLLARARGVAVMMVPAAGARYGVARDGNRFKPLRAGIHQRQPFSLPTRAREGRGGDDGAGGRREVGGGARRQ